MAGKAEEMTSVVHKFVHVRVVTEDGDSALVNTNEAVVGDGKMPHREARRRLLRGLAGREASLRRRELGYCSSVPLSWDQASAGYGESVKVKV